MKLEMGEQARERPVSHSIEETIKEQKQDIKSAMKKECVLEAADKTSKKDTKWNISRSAGSDHLAVLMSEMSLVRQNEKHEGEAGDVQVLCRLVKRALARAGQDEVKVLGALAAGGSKTEFLLQLRKVLLLEKTSTKGCEPQTHSKDSDVSDRTREERLTHKATEPAKLETCVEAEKKKKRGVLKELKEDNDLCPRSPMRPQQHRMNNFLPYQNASRVHHSGGIMSTVAYSDPIAPTPQYHHLTFQSLIPSASSPPLVVESSSVPGDTGLEDLDDLSFSEVDMEVLRSMVASTCFKHPIDCEEAPLLPEPVFQINSSQYDATTDFFNEVDHQVPTDVTVAKNIVEELVSPSANLASSSPWPSYYDDSTSGCSSLSPNSVSSSSPGGLSPDSRRVVPDESDVRNLGPNMSPPGQFFDDNVPLTNYNLNVHVYAKDAGYCDAGYSPMSSGYSSINTPSPTDYPCANIHDTIPEDFDTTVQNASNDYFSSLDTDFNSDLLLPEFENVFDPETLNECSQTNRVQNSYNTSPYSANIATSPHAMSENTTRTNHSSSGIPCVNTFNNIPDLANEVNKMSTTFTTLVNVSTHVLPVQNFTIVDSTPITVNAANIQLAMPVSKTNLKRLEPKVEHLLRAETGKERILNLLDPKKKAEAWVNISLKIKEVTQQDNDGDTQLMILCANAGGSVQDYALEYIYALVETLKGIPRALSAVNHQRHSALYLAALHSDYTNRAIVVRYIAETLVELGEDIAHTNEGGDTILHEVCQQGDQRYDVLVELLSLTTQTGQPYFNVNQYTAKGLTPLHLAVMSHGANNVTCLKTVQLLMAERADILMPEKTQSYTALHLAILKSCAPRLVRALLRGGHSQASGRVCNTLNNNRDSPLHCAASRNDLPVKQQMTVIQLLLEHGAVKSLNAGGKFPIALVAEERRQEIRRVYEIRKGSQGNIGMS